MDHFAHIGFPPEGPIMDEAQPSWSHRRRGGRMELCFWREPDAEGCFSFMQFGHLVERHLPVTLC